MSDSTYQSLLDEARRHAEVGRSLHAMQILVRVIELNPDKEEAYVVLSRLYAAAGNLEHAEHILMQGYLATNAQSRFLFLLGDLNMQEHQYARAIRYFEQLSGERFPEAQLQLGLAYVKTGDTRHAETALRRAVTLDPNLNEGCEALGDILLQRGMFSEAIKFLKRGLLHDPFSSRAHRLLGTAFMHLMDWGRALSELSLAVDADPDDDVAYHLCGAVLMELGKLDDAESHLQRALEINPGNADAAATFGHLCLRRDAPQEARRAFERALKYQPQHPQALRGKYLLMRQGQQIS